MAKNSLFARFAKVAARGSGHAISFIAAAALILLWLAAGPLFGWNDTWQLTINTVTTIVTFLMVFIIQNTQTRDSEAMQIKLDALLESQRKESLMGLEELPEGELRAIQKEYEAKAERAGGKRALGKSKSAPRRKRA